MNEITTNNLDQIPYGITKIRDYENVYEYKTRPLKCSKGKSNFPKANLMSWTARYKPYQRIIALKNYEHEIDYVSVNLPEHLLVTNFSRCHTTCRYKNKDYYMLKKSYLFLIEDNKLYPPYWYNVNNAGSICWNMKLIFYIKNNAAKNTINKFWKSIFTLDMKYHRNNFKHNTNAIKDNVNFNDFIYQIIPN